MGQLSKRRQAALFHGRERRRSLQGIPELTRTAQIYGTTVMEVANLDTGELFPSRLTPITFRTKIEITDNSGEHRGIVFEFGDDAIGCVLWIGDETIGFHAGEDGTVNGATALYDLGAELPVGGTYDLVAAVRPGDGRVRLWSNGLELARATASSNGFGTAGTWAADSEGSFASAKQGTVVPDLPAASDKAPDGFTVVSPLSVYLGQVPKHFV